MPILPDHGTPAPLRQKLPDHPVSTAYEMDWAELDNGTSLTAAMAHASGCALAAEIEAAVTGVP
jgi:hypothetical protein